MKNDVQLLMGSSSDIAWFKENSKNLIEQYEGEIIAIKDKSVVAFAPDSNILFRKLEEKGVDNADVIIKSIPAKNQIIIL